MSKGLTITAFVLSIIIPPIGLILGIIAYSQAKEDSAAMKGLAIAAIVIGIVFTIIPLLVILLTAATWWKVSGTVDQGADQIDLETKCVLSDIMIQSADPMTNKVSLNVMGDVDKLKISINGIPQSDYNLNGDNDFDLNLDINSGDVIKIIPVIGEFECSNYIEYTIE